jgi:GrpB-like predicted nucleotidyltransferase (UPF0157 family)
MPIEIVDYDPSWPEAFALEAERLRAALGTMALAVDHVGSTSVPGLAAKPVIDIQVSVDRLEPVDGYRARLAGIGYAYETVPLVYFHRPEQWPHTHHVHVRQHGGADERRTLVFRDWLRAHPEDRDAYEALKRSLAEDGDADTVEGRFRYSEAKTAFIREIERRSFAVEARRRQSGRRVQ